MDVRETLLINQIQPEEDRDREARIFFLIGDMVRVRETVMNMFNSISSPFYKRCTFKCNGITLTIPIGKIPDVIGLLVKAGISVYSVYELYEPA